MSGIQIMINPKISNRGPVVPVVGDGFLRKNYFDKFMDDGLTKATAASERTKPSSSYHGEEDSLGDGDTLSDDGSFASVDTHLLTFSTFGTQNMRSVMACGNHLGRTDGPLLYTLADATVAVGSVAFQRGRATADMLSAVIRGNRLGVDEEDAAAQEQNKRQGSLSSEIKEKMERLRAEREERRERAQRRRINPEKVRADDLMRARQEISGLAAAWRQS